MKEDPGSWLDTGPLLPDAAIWGLNLIINLYKSHPMFRFGLVVVLLHLLSPRAVRKTM